MFQAHVSMCRAACVCSMIQGMITFEGDATILRNYVRTEDSDEGGRGGAISNTGSGSMWFKGNLRVENNAADVSYVRTSVFRCIATLSPRPRATARLLHGMRQEVDLKEGRREKTVRIVPLRYPESTGAWYVNVTLCQISSR